MNNTFYMLGMIAYFLGFVVLVTAKGAIQENVALMILLNGTLFIVGGGIISAIINKSKEIKDEDESDLLSEIPKYEIDKNPPSYTDIKSKKGKNAKY